jgi:hypothetical protein
MTRALAAAAVLAVLALAGCGSTKTVAKDVPGPRVTVTKTVPHVTRTVTVKVPGPRITVTETAK